MALIIGLTGGIGSGKTIASQWFAQQHIDIIDADVIAHQIVQPPSIVLEHIRHHFGDWVLQDDGTLNRRALREYIFNHPDARQQLEQLTHPAIRQQIIQQLNHSHSPYSILVSPLLFETEQHLLVQRTLLIDVDETIQLQRASQRDTQSIENIKKIIQSQMPITEKRLKADDIIKNNHDLNTFYLQLAQLHKKYLELSKSFH